MSACYPMLTTERSWLSEGCACGSLRLVKEQPWQLRAWPSVWAIQWPRAFVRCTLQTLAVSGAPRFRGVWYFVLSLLPPPHLCFSLAPTLRPVLCRVSCCLLRQPFQLFVSGCAFTSPNCFSLSNDTFSAGCLLSKCPSPAACSNPVTCPASCQAQIQTLAGCSALNSSVSGPVINLIGSSSSLPVASSTRSAISTTQLSSPSIAPISIPVSNSSGSLVLSNISIVVISLVGVFIIAMIATIVYFHPNTRHRFAPLHSSDKSKQSKIASQTPLQQIQYDNPLLHTPKTPREFQNASTPTNELGVVLDSTLKPTRREVLAQRLSGHIVDYPKPHNVQVVLNSPESSIDQVLPNSRASSSLDSEFDGAGGDIPQNVLVVDETEKLQKLLELVSNYRFLVAAKGRLVIFTCSDVEAENVESFLIGVVNFSVIRVGNQFDRLMRIQAMENFGEGASILIVTDNSAKGCKIRNVDVLINFTFPQSMEEYRVRITKIRKNGSIHTFLTKENSWQSVDFLKIKIPEELDKEYRNIPSSIFTSPLSPNKFAQHKVADPEENQATTEMGGGSTTEIGGGSTTEMVAGSTTKNPLSRIITENITRKSTIDTLTTESVTMSETNSPIDIRRGLPTVN
ncbi:RNA-dependent ATPase [Nowakowskiella sp. JEL0078]|nr:RNA-dependent ATPase [Nowakowskiella sp. JEL0078]